MEIVNYEFSIDVVDGWRRELALGEMIEGPWAE